MRVIFNIEKNYRMNNDLTFVLCELIPGISIRYIRGGFGREVNMYVSWLFWEMSITLSFKNTRKD